MADPTKAARLWREERFRRRVDTALLHDYQRSLGGTVLISPLPPGREVGDLGEMVTPAPPPENEIVALVADQEVGASGTFLTWRAVTNPPARRGFDYLTLPATDVPLTFAAAYTVALEIDWHSGQGGAVEVWVGGNRHHVAQTSRAGNVSTELAVVERGSSLRIRTRHAGTDPARVSAKLTVRLGSSLPRRTDEDPEEGETTAAPNAPGAPAAIPGAELDNAYVDISWGAVSGAGRYEAQVMHVELGYTESVIVEGNSTTDARIEWLEVATDYVARVRALAEGTTGSEWSDDTPFTTPLDENPPAAPTGLQVTAGFTTVIAAWAPNTEHDVAGGAGVYEFELAADSSGSPGAVVGEKETAATVASFSGLSEDTTYHARLRAVDSSGNASEWTSWVEVTTSFVPEPEMRDFTTNPILHTEIGEEEVRTPNIQANAIDVGKIQVDSLVGSIAFFNEFIARTAIMEHIAADTAFLANLVVDNANIANLHGSKIDANSINVNRLASSVLEARTITLGAGGVLIAGNATNGVRLNSAGLQMLSGGTTVVNLPSNGSTPTMTGGLRTAVSGQRIEISDTWHSFYTSNSLQFWTGADHQPGLVFALRDTANVTSLTLTAPRPSSAFGQASIAVKAYDGTGLGEVAIQNAELWVANKSWFGDVDAVGDLTVGGTIASNGMVQAFNGGAASTSFRFAGGGANTGLYYSSFLSYGAVLGMSYEGGTRFFIRSDGGLLSGGGKGYRWHDNYFEPSDDTSGNPNLGRTATDRRWDRLFAINATNTSSDRRLKEDVRDTPLGLDFIDELHIVDFLRKGGSRRHQGLIAQEVHDALVAVGYSPDDFSAYQDPTKSDDAASEDDEYLGLVYEEFLPIALRGIQELRAETRDLRSQLEAIG